MCRLHTGQELVTSKNQGSRHALWNRWPQGRRLTRSFTWNSQRQIEQVELHSMTFSMSRTPFSFWWNPMMWHISLRIDDPLMLIHQQIKGSTFERWSAFWCCCRVFGACWWFAWQCCGPRNSTWNRYTRRWPRQRKWLRPHGHHLLRLCYLGINQYW